jgi:putative DNA primase/helicase
VIAPDPADSGSPPASGDGSNPPVLRVVDGHDEARSLSAIDREGAKAVSLALRGDAVQPAEIGRLMDEWSSLVRVIMATQGRRAEKMAAFERHLNPVSDANRYRHALRVVENEPADEGVDAEIKCTDVGNARRLVKLYGHKIRFCHTWGCWLIYDGRRWAEDKTGEIVRLAKATVKNIGIEASVCDDSYRKDLLRWAIKSESHERIKAMIALAQTEPSIPVVTSDLDNDRYLFNCANGTIDLRTGSLRPHDPADNLTKLSPVAYRREARSDAWDRFVMRIMNEDRELVEFVQRAAGYSLTGDTSEQCLFFLYGEGANGKSTFLNILQGILGDSAITVGADLITSKASHHENHTTGLTDLDGARFVATVEVDDGKRLAEALVKSMTGGERIRARRMRQDNYEFLPQFKLWLAANHKPEIRGTDHGIWRRIRLIPFVFTIPDDEKDKHFAEKMLEGEAEGILNWLVQGCLDWKKAGGMGDPEAVKAATADYRKEMDTIANFIGDCCLTGNNSVRYESTALYKAYTTWADENGIKNPLTARKFARELTRLGYVSQESNGKTFRVGIGVR